jgi:hypothetical protein
MPFVEVAPVFEVDGWKKKYGTPMSMAKCLAKA